MNREEKKPNLINDIVSSWVYDIIKNNQKFSEINYARVRLLFSGTGRMTRDNINS